MHASAVMQGQETTPADQLTSWPVCWAESRVLCKGLHAEDNGAATAADDLKWLLPLLPASDPTRNLLPGAEEVLARAEQRQVVESAQRTIAAAITAAKGPASDISASDHTPGEDMAGTICRAAAAALDAGFSGKTLRSCSDGVRAQAEWPCALQ